MHDIRFWRWGAGGKPEESAIAAVRGESVPRAGEYVTIAPADSSGQWIRGHVRKVDWIYKAGRGTKEGVEQFVDVWIK